MNKTPNDGGPAFPIKINHLHHIADESGVTVATASQDLGTYPGMSLRDWFAGMALQGIVVNNGIDTPYLTIADWAYSTADAMLTERSKDA